MEPGEQYDAVIVGASVAGCTAATLLARGGARVALVERQASPDAYKVMCTHFIQASATPVIQRLGLDGPIEAAGGLRNGVEAWTRYGWVRPRPQASDPLPAYGYDIRREKLDPMLRALAAETDGVELMAGWTVSGLLDGDGRPAGVVARDRDGEEREIRAKVVVAADGRDSRVAKMANVPARVKPHARFGYYAYYKDLPIASGDSTLFWFLDPDVAYAFPQDDGLTLMATFQSKDRLPWFKRNLEENFTAYFEGLPNAPDLSTGERVSKILGKTDMPNVSRPAARPGIAFVGDAALAADPLWGVGCGFAFQSGAWLADALAGTFGGGAAAVDEGLKAYRKRHRQGLAAHHFLISDYSTARRFSAVEKVLFAGSARDEKATQMFHEFGTRSVRPTDAAFGKLVARSARAVLTRRRPAERGELTGRHAEGTPPPADVRRSRITVAGISTPVSEAGPAGAGEAVLFVHGNPGSSRDWDDLVSRTGESGRAVAFDMPGFGRAGKPREFDHTVPGYAAFLGEAIDALGLERVHLVLHDFGGPWGLEWATLHPDAVTSVTLIDTGAMFTSWHYLAKIWRTPVAGEIFQATTTRSGLRMALRHGNPRGLPRPFVDRMFDDADAATKRAILKLYRSVESPADLARRHVDALRPYDYPSLVVWGAHDPYLHVRLAEEQRQMLPSADVRIMDDSGHWPMADNPEGLARIVMPFLERQLAPAAREEAEQASPEFPGSGRIHVGSRR